MWIPVDTRLGDHPNVRSICRMTKCDRLKVVGALVTIWGLCADLETEELTFHLSIEEEYDLPEGIIAAMVTVGWATAKPDSVVVHTRNGERDQAREARREIALRGGLARAAQQAAASSSKQAASSQQAGSCSATEKQTDIERKKQRRGSSPPPALEGAGGLSAAAAMREAMASIGAAPPAVRPNPTQALLALKEAS